jgi:hypothetical protein
MGDLLLEHILEIKEKQGNVIGTIEAMSKDVAELKAKVDNCKQTERLNKIESDLFAIEKEEARKSGMVKVIVAIGGFIGGLVSVIVSWFISKL